MVQYCVAYGCKELSCRGTSVLFHRFPSDENLRKLWEISLRREQFQASKYSRLCSKHFAPECFDVEAFGIGRKLKKGAVPSIFEFPDHLQTQTKKRKFPKERAAASSSFCEPHSSTEINAKTPRVAYLGDITDDTPLTPKKVNKCLNVARQRVTTYRKKLKLVRQQCHRSILKNKNLSGVLKHLKDRQMINEAASNTLEKTLSPFLEEIIQRAGRGTTRKSFSPELRTFALTLNFYSAKAYEYVRKMFVKALPHPITFQKWYSSVDGKPGFSKEAFSALKIKCEENQASGKKTVCALMLDEIAIRKQIEFDGQRYTGYIDFGTGFDDYSLPEAKEALVFMLVAFNGNWKIPVEYFLIDSLDGGDRANLVRQCLQMINEYDIVIASLTFDGAASNISMAGHLGANLSLPNLKSWFLNQVTGEKVYIFLDPCHMLKLIRNCLASRGSLAADKDLVLWKYFEDLEALQRTEGLHAATKLNQRHINWSREKMKVKLVAQTFSQSVTDALLFCEQDLKLAGFQGAEASSHFSKVFNDLFDVFNSRNLLSKGYKAPLNENTIADSIEFLLKAKAYILSLNETVNGTPLCHSNRKTGFIGFIVCIESIIALYDDIVRQKKLLNFLLTYKFSQDHLEIFFSEVRSRGGHNNNPTARQFEAAFKRLLVHIQVGGRSNSNCLALDSTSILNVPSTLQKVCNESSFDSQPNYADHDHDYAVPNVNTLTAYVDNVVEYISGFVVKGLKKSITCITCLKALSRNNNSSGSSFLLRRKDRGGLVSPSADVTKVCRIVEIECRISDISGVHSTLSNKAKSKIVNTALMKMDSDIFSVLDYHILNQEPIDNHKIQLIKAVALKYANIRFYHAGKEQTAALHDKRVRSIYTKLVLFKNQ